MREGEVFVVVVVVICTILWIDASWAGLECKKCKTKERYFALQLPSAGAISIDLLLVAQSAFCKFLAVVLKSSSHSVRLSLALAARWKLGRCRCCCCRRQSASQELTAKSVACLPCLLLSLLPAGTSFSRSRGSPSPPPPSSTSLPPPPLWRRSPGGVVRLLLFSPTQSHRRGRKAPSGSPGSKQHPFLLPLLLFFPVTSVFTHTRSRVAVLEEGELINISSCPPSPRLCLCPSPLPALSHRHHSLERSPPSG